jgi:CheY-like chemotaxis protein
MANLRDLVTRVHATPGVVSTAVVGRDGLVIDAAGLDGAEADHVAALAPGLVAAAEMLADASASGTVRAVVVEGAERVLLAMPLSTEVTLLAVVAGGDVGCRARRGLGGRGVVRAPTRPARVRGARMSADPSPRDATGPDVPRADATRDRAEPAGSVRHVLVADDEPHIGRIIQMKLEQGPFRVTLVQDGREALAALEHGPAVDLVLLDLMMPHLSGLDVLGRMRADPRFRDVRA